MLIQTVIMQCTRMLGLLREMQLHLILQAQVSIFIFIFFFSRLYCTWRPELKLIR